MIEATDLSPGLDVVASFAAQRASIRAPSCHLVAEFSLVRVRVAGGTAPILKVERQNLVRSPAQPNLVAIGAGNCRMRSLQREPRVAMLCNRIAGAMPIPDVVAVFAAILVARRGKLTVVRILMAIQTGSELHLVNRVFPGRSMALRTLHLDVLAR